MYAKFINNEELKHQIDSLGDLNELYNNCITELVEIIRRNNPVLTLAIYALLSRTGKTSTEPLFLPRYLAYLQYVIEENFICENIYQDIHNYEEIQRIQLLIEDIVLATSLIDSKRIQHDGTEYSHLSADLQKLQDICITGKGYKQIRQEIFTNICRGTSLPSDIIHGNELYNFIDAINKYQVEQIKIFQLFYSDFNNWRKSEKSAKIIDSYAESTFKTLSECFEISCFQKQFAEIFHLFSVDMSKRTNEQANHKSPTSGYTYSDKPIWKVGNKYYFYNVIEFEDNLFAIYCKYLYSKSPSWKDKLTIARDKYLESRSSELLAQGLNADYLYRNAEYDSDEKTYETDAIIISDNDLFIVESKASKFRPSALRGAPKSFNDQLKSSIKYGDEQAERVINILHKDGKHSFRCGGLTHQIDMQNIRKIHKIIVLYEDLSPHTAAPEFLVNSGILSPQNSAWVVSLHDLIAISTVLDKPYLLHLYIDKREELARRFDIRFHDEMEILGYFLSEGWQLPQKTGYSYNMAYFSGPVDEFFEHGGSKPRFQLPENISKMLDILSESHTANWSQLAKSLILSSHDTAESIDKLIKQSIDNTNNGIFCASSSNSADLSLLLYYETEPGRLNGQSLQSIARELDNSSSFTYQNNSYAIVCAREIGFHPIKITKFY